MNGVESTITELEAELGEVSACDIQNGRNLHCKTHGTWLIPE